MRINPELIFFNKQFRLFIADFSANHKSSVTRFNFHALLVMMMMMFDFFRLR